MVFSLRKESNLNVPKKLLVLEQGFVPTRRAERQRDDKIYLIDYKTGSPTAEKCNDFKGYLPQMTLYRWAIENEFDMEITATYLNIPKKIKDFYVKVNRSKRIDEVVFEMCERFCKRYEKFKRTDFYFQIQ